MSKTIATLYPHRFQAEAAVDDLVGAGHNRDNFSILSYRDIDDGDVDASDVQAADNSTNAARGAAAGAVGGAAGGILAALGLAALPGVGWVMAAGPIGALLASGVVAGAAGAAGGGIVGALTDNGIENEDAEVYAEAIRRGGTLVVVDVASEDEPMVKAILQKHNPLDIERTVGRWKENGWNGYDPAAAPLGADAIARERALFADHTDYSTRAPLEEKRYRYVRTYETEARPHLHM